MNYTDEASRLTFHKSKTMLQMICQAFEGICFNFGIEPEFIDLLDEDRALMGLPDVTEEHADAIKEKMNTQFPRTDDFLTCTVNDTDFNLFEIFVTTSNDLMNLN